MHLIPKKKNSSIKIYSFSVVCRFVFFSPLFILMLFSRLLISKIKFSLSFYRLKSTIKDINLIDEINKIKSKDLIKIFNDEQIKKFFQLKRLLGGKFQSIEQIQNDKNIQIDCKNKEIFFTKKFL